MLNAEILKELTEYNLLSDFKELKKYKQIIKITDTDLNKIITNPIIAYYSGTCNNNGEFICTRVNNNKPEKALLYVAENTITLDLLEQTMNRIKTEFGEDIEIFFGNAKSPDENLRIFFIAC